jgi:starch phosphorylase
VRVEHVEAHGPTDAPTLGDTVTIRASVALGELTPADVTVQVVAGTVDADDVLRDPEFHPMEAVEHNDGRVWVFETRLTLTRNGTLGYSVRALPHHEGLTSGAELGLVASPAAGEPELILR